MDEARWSALAEKFAELAALGAAERQERLAAIDDVALRVELERMLAAHHSDRRLQLEVQLTDALDGTAPPPPRETIGPYRLVSLLGRGGMGEVWLAERDEGGFSRRVAIKRVLHGLGGAELRRRFEIERQALARLSHRSIAQLLDGGIDEDGVPYLVLEYVRGEPLTLAADRRRLSIADRLELFGQVCEAVHYAHRHLVVHRDLKPSNIFLTDEGEVRLLDFGIAKLLDPEAAERGLTRTAMRLATPEYASPEQLAGEAITTATDVHGLGLLLFELLTGRRAFREHERSPATLESAVRTVDPHRPSAVVARDQEAATIAHARGTTPAALVRTLRGDLDTIVATALRKDPVRRYPSVERLAEDLARWGRNLPIRARPDSLGYRLRKLVARHRVAAGLAVALAAAVVGFALYAWHQAQLLSAERDAARLERDKANEVSAFLIDLFGADPFADQEGVRDTTTLGEFLARGERSVRDELAERPALRAALLARLGRLRGNLGQLEPARRLAEEALAIRRELPGDARAEVAESLITLATIHQDQGELEAAVAMFREALALREAVFPELSWEVAEAVHNLASALASADPIVDIGEVERLARRGLELRRQLFGEVHPDTIQSRNMVGVLFYRRRSPGDLEEAERQFREVVAARIELLGEDHPTVANARSNQARALAARGRFREAIPLYRAAIDGWTAGLGADHPLVVRGLNGLAEALTETGDLAGAQEAARRAQAIEEGRAAGTPKQP